MIKLTSDFRKYFGKSQANVSKLEHQFVFSTILNVVLNVYFYEKHIILSFVFRGVLVGLYFL